MEPLVLDAWYVWIIAGIAFILVEFFTFAFYGASLALAAFVTAIYAFSMDERLTTINQTLVFVAMSTLLCIVLPRMVRRFIPDTVKIGADRYIGTKATLMRHGTEYKIRLDGVEYLVDSDSLPVDTPAGQEVRIVSHQSGTFRVEVIHS